MHLRRLLNSPAVKLCSRRNYGGGHHPVQSTYNDIPTPQGSWQTNYDANQRKYNAHLVIGVGTLVGTIIFGKAAGFLEFYSDYPERPADIPSYK